MGNIVQPIWNDCPAATRLVVVGYPVLSLASLSPLLEYYVFLSCWSTVVRGLRVWSLVLASFHRSVGGAGMNILFLLFEMYSISQYLPIRERDMGSSLMLVWLMTMAFVINSIHLIITALVRLVWVDLYYNVFPRMEFEWDPMDDTCVPSQGLWPLILMLIAIRCMGDPDGTTSAYGLCAIPNKYYPACLAAFFFFLGGRSFDLLCGVTIGYLYPRLNIERILPSRARIAALERRCCGERRSLLGASWIMACDTSGFEVERGLQPYSAVSDFGRVSAQGREMTRVSNSARADRFEAFAGSGNRLGDGNPEPPIVEDGASADAPETQPSLQASQAEEAANAASSAALAEDEEKAKLAAEDPKDAAPDPEGL
mmetsp:Transcript_69438/g.166465  ORF Transcript_69438/g.166465 Transcript_69438/m.166465 type:complete len:370 (+) Transcript_69438:48-1157(+)